MRRPIPAAFACLIATAGCSPDLNWREVRGEGAAEIQMFPCKPVRQQRTVRLQGKPRTLVLLVCDAGEVSWAQASCESESDADAQALAMQLLRSLSDNLGAAPETATRVGSVVWLQGHAPDGRPVEAAVRVRQHGGQVVQSTAIGRHVPRDQVEMFMSAQGRLP